MILFQIDNNDRSFMHDLLVRYFDFQGFCDSLREKYPEIESAKFKRLSTQNASLHMDLFKSLLLSVKEFLNDHFHNYFSVGNEMFDAFEDADDSFFWDTIIALYMQLIYDQSTLTSMRSFYEINFKQYGIKYNSYTDYFKTHIYDQPMGEYLNIQTNHPEKSHPRRLIMNCFPIQQYVLIHSFSKSPYCKTPSNNSSQNLFKMQEYIRSILLEQEAAYTDSAICHFNEIVQSVCEKISQKTLNADKERFIFHRDPRDNQMENQLTAYIVEQAYHYEIFSQVASAKGVIDRFKQLRTHDKSLYKMLSERIEIAKKMEFIHGKTLQEIIKFLSVNDEIAAYLQDLFAFQTHLGLLTNITLVSSVLTRPYIAAYWLNNKSWIPDTMEFRLRASKEFYPIFYMANAYIPLVQEFYLQVLRWLFPMPDSKIELHRFLKQLLIENLEEWNINNRSIGNLTPLEGKVLGLLFEVSRTNHRTVDAIKQEHLILDFSNRVKTAQ